MAQGVLCFSDWIRMKDFKGRNTGRRSFLRSRGERPFYLLPILEPKVSGRHRARSRHPSRYDTRVPERIQPTVRFDLLESTISPQPTFEKLSTPVHVFFSTRNWGVIFHLSGTPSISNPAPRAWLSWNARFNVRTDEITNTYPQKCESRFSGATFSVVDRKLLWTRI
ncbi:uncharacterized protein CLUP02_08049 [Colletotrichum lupini]|uniref:Uncharacterized protein n=1 Tax=Colletotrichum lupini TaxID=145971 RepID=A0A9Q8SSD9_9PEZI|nr:uncharacterized protein CLUP02_08049 [Colletotrichum lupini]UQC82560.1 hypothetical protein CLUP02_08049 [Colletotrichum lupini]